MLSARIHNPVMVIAAPKLQLLIVLIDPRAYGFRMGEIKWRTLDAARIRRGNKVASTGLNCCAWMVSL